MTSISVTTEPVSEPEPPSLGGLTPDGNLALIDDILDGSYYSSEEIGEGGSGSETGSVVTLMLVMGPPGSFAPSSFEA